MDSVEGGEEGAGAGDFDGVLAEFTRDEAFDVGDVWLGLVARVGADRLAGSDVHSGVARLGS